MTIPTRRSFAAALIASVWFAGCSDASGPTWFLERPIVFAGSYTIERGPHDIYRIMPDGRGLRNLTNGKFGDALNPRWSPDGSAIAFTAGSDNFSWGAWVMRGDGSGAHLVSNPNDQCNAYVRMSWSPSGDRLLGDCGMVEQFVINVGNRTSYSLTQRWGNVADYPDWSPIDDRIAYLRGPNISVANLDGSSARVVAANANEAAWSPDGTRIAFVRTDPDQSQVVWIVNADSTKERQVESTLNGKIWDDAPAWSPDGSRLVFWRFDTADPPAGAYLVVVSADGGTPKRITPDWLLATKPDW